MRRVTLVVPYDGAFGTGYVVTGTGRRIITSEGKRHHVPLVLPQRSGAAILLDDARIGDLDLETFVASMASIGAQTSHAILEQHVEHLHGVALTYDTIARASLVQTSPSGFRVIEYPQGAGLRDHRGTTRSITRLVDDTIASRYTKDLRDRGYEEPRTWIGTENGLIALDAVVFES